MVSSRGKVDGLTEAPMLMQCWTPDKLMLCKILCLDKGFGCEIIRKYGGNGMESAHMCLVAGMGIGLWA